MPADVAMHTNFLHYDKASSKQSNVDSCWNTENMSGYMTLLGPSSATVAGSGNAGGSHHHRQSVQVKVYRTSIEHFAVIYPQKKLCRPLGVLNLRNTTIERLGGGVGGDGGDGDEVAEAGFLVRQKGCDSPVALTFILENPKDLDYWVLAFTARSSPMLHQSSLPIVEEEEI